MSVPSAEAEDEELSVGVAATLASVFGPRRPDYRVAANVIAKLREKLAACEGENKKLKQELAGLRATFMSYRVTYLVR